MGFGAIVKLLLVAKAKGITALSLAATFPVLNGEPEADFAALFDTLTIEEKSRLEGVPKNLGEVKKMQKTPKVR